MDKFSEEEIAALLRLKRHEQPPPGYFDNFVQEFHRRQRAELLRQPFWRVALQRTQDFMLQLNVTTLSSYPAAAAAVVILAAVVSLKVSQAPDPANSGAVAVAQNETAPVASRGAEGSWSLSTPVSTRDLGATSVRMTTERVPFRAPTATPRYVLDSTPVSYEAPLRF